MSERSRYEEYLICQERGHTPGNMMIDTNPPYHVCEKCGTSYRYEQQVVEANAPKPPEDKTA